MYMNQEGQVSKEFIRLHYKLNNTTVHVALRNVIPIR